MTILREYIRELLEQAPATVDTRAVSKDLARKITSSDPTGFIQLATKSGILKNRDIPGHHIRLRPNPEIKKLPGGVDRIDHFEAELNRIIGGIPGLTAKSTAGAKDETAGSVSGKYKTIKLEYSPESGSPYNIDLVMQTGKKAKGKPGDVSNFFLGILSEYATIDGINGGNQFDTAVSDQLISAEYLALAKNPAAEKMLRSIYDKCIECASKAFKGQSRPEGTAFPGNASAAGGEGTSTSALVDVLIKNGDVITGDVHVKFNDFERLMGLQATGPDGKKVIMGLNRLEDALDSSWPASAQYKWLRNQFAKDHLLKDVELTQGRSAISQADEAGIELDMFHKPETRRAFLEFLDSNGLPDKIRSELSTFLKEAGLGKAVYFFKYGTSPKQVNLNNPVNVFLEVEQITGKDTSLEVRPEPNDVSTYPYTVLYDGEPIFRIETRTSGQGHPMQVKSASKKFIDKWNEKNKGTEEIGVDVLQTGVKAALSSMSKKWKVTGGTAEPLAERVIRGMIRRSLLNEELTRSDRKEIERLARKMIEKDRAEQKKVARKEAEAEIKKALGVSFFGYRGKINKFVVDSIHEEVNKWLKDKATRQEIGEITKDIMIKLYRELSFNSSRTIGRIKI